MVGLQQLQPGHVHIQIHAFLDARVPGAQGLDLGKGKRRLVHIVAASHRAFTGHDLRNEFLLVLHRLPEVGIKRPFGDVAEHMDGLVLVALAFNSAFPLGQVAGPPGAVQVMQRHKPVLHVGPGSHLLCTAEQNAHLTGTDFGEQLFFPHLGVGLMNECDLLGGHPLGNEFLPNVLIDGEGRFRFVQRHCLLQRMKRGIVQRLGCLFCRPRLGRGNVAEYQLGQLVSLPVPPDLQDVLHTLVDLCAGFVR